MTASTLTTSVLPKSIARAYPTVGNDPEFFLLDDKGIVLPAESFCAMSDVMASNKTIHPDNAAMELNPPPSGCLQAVNTNIGAAFAAVRTLMAEKKINAKVSLRPTEEINLDDANKYPSLIQFGCSPAQVYRKKSVITVVPRVDPRATPSRSVGFHIHLGRDDQLSHTVLRGDKILKLIQMCDILVGVPGVILERDERVVQRRKYIGYGRAGEFRVQPHGVEYRTLGAWPLIHPFWTYWANCAGRDALGVVGYGWDDHFLEHIDMEEVAKCINSNDLALAFKIWHQAKQVVKAINVEMTGSSIVFNRLALKRFDWILGNKAPNEFVSLSEFDWGAWTMPNGITGKYNASLRAADVGFLSYSASKIPSEWADKWSFDVRVEDFYKR